MLSTITYIRERLSSLYSERDINTFIRWLMEEIAHVPPYRLIMKDEKLEKKVKEKIIEATERLTKFEPIQYIIGETFFNGHTFKVTPDVLIPRPETVQLVQWIIQDYKGKAASILDIGTGSGCIAISLALELHKAKVSGVDVSQKALSVAQNNSKENDVAINWLLLDILSDNALSLLERYDCIVSNPPYIMEKEKVTMERNVLDYEPKLALFVPDNDPLLFYRRIAQLGKTILKKGGNLYFEINESCAAETIDLLKGENYQKIELAVDYNGKDRFIKAGL